MARALWRSACTVVAYVATPDEVDTAPLLRAALAAGKTLVLPAIAGGNIVWRVVTDLATQLEQGRFGIQSPAASARDWYTGLCREPVVWIVPGVGFDRQGNRLGRGGGYYDRALRAANARRGTVGLAFPCQMVNAIPAGDGDWPVTFVATADTWIAAVTGQEATRD